MTKSELKELMRKYCLFYDEIENFCNFCSELLEKRAKETERDFPYAIAAIQKDKVAAYAVSDLVNYIDEILEGEDNE